jgi:hypothetical protein
MPKIRNFNLRGGDWLRTQEMPFSRFLCDKLEEEGNLFCVVVKSRGSRRGVKLYSRESLNSYLKSLGEKQREEAGV